MLGSIFLLVSVWIVLFAFFHTMLGEKINLVGQYALAFSLTLFYLGAHIFVAPHIEDFILFLIYAGFGLFDLGIYFLLNQWIKPPAVIGGMEEEE